MNRFFSRLDLREIRIDPRSSRFPPGTDESDDAATDDHLVQARETALEWPHGDGVAVPSVPPPPSAAAWEISGVASDTDGATESGSPESASSPGEVLSPNGAGDDVLKVSARSRPSAVAGAIAGVVRESGRAEVQAIGAGATNQAVKAVAIARDYLQETGIDVICLPAFIDVTIGDEDRTAIRLVIEPR